MSAKGYKSLDFHVRAPALLRGRLELDGGTRWWDYTQEDYFGLGESQASRPNATIATIGLGVNLVARFRLHRRLSVGEEFGYLRPDIEDGTDDRVSVDRRVVHRRRGARAGRASRAWSTTAAFVDFDYRDQPGNPRGGGRVLFQIGTGRDQDPSREFSYRRTDLEVMHVFPIFDKKRNFAVRFAASHVDPLNAGGRVPFFLSPTIGGSHTVRSYRELRFRDATYVLLNGEYRWEALLGPRPRAVLGWRRRRHHAASRSGSTSSRPAGASACGSTPISRIFMRIDAGFGGPEGRAMFFKFSPAF